jgi:hypothetical protein
MCRSPGAEAPVYLQPRLTALVLTDAPSISGQVQF